MTSIEFIGQETKMNVSINAITSKVILFIANDENPTELNQQIELNEDDIDILVLELQRLRRLI
jgi:hypothetical protein